jgi:hypothetical protein
MLVAVSSKASCFGVSLVTESDIGASFSGLIYRELRDSTGPTQIGYSAHWRADNDNPALASFLEPSRGTLSLAFDMIFSSSLSESATCRHEPRHHGCTKF